MPILMVISRTLLVFKVVKLDFNKKPKDKPDNILIDYDLNGGVVSNFSSILADWGTAGGSHNGGTPLYAGPRTYELDNKDIFSFGRLALELYEKGISQQKF